MADEQKAKQRLEIAHVLFMDIVDYSKLLTDEQSEALQELSQIVRNTETACEAEAAGQLTILPTGDGMALVFTGSVEEPVECALEISHALRAQPSLPVRMGIHSGPVHHVKDANQRENIAGVGINIAQRVMDCGDAGHILVSKRVADDLAQQRRWQPYLHELGDVEVKHGVVVSLVNLYAETIGNPTPPARIGKVRAAVRSTTTATRRGLSLFARAIFIVAVLLLALAIVSVIFAPAIMRSLRKSQVTSPQVPAIPSPPSIADAIKSQVAKKVTDALQDALSTEKKTAIEPSPTGSVVPEKSIAVLPFENLSDDKSNAYFAEGIQDEILTRLAKIGALKVISRTSTSHFASSPQNLPEIARQLGVANILEGSVQKIANAVHVNVQLIRAATDEHLWAESYNRKLDDVFAVEGEVAGAIADQLNAKLTGAEKRELAARPTNNPEAYDAYLRGSAQHWQTTEASQNAAVHSFEEAVRLDPQFAGAWAALSRSHSLIFFHYDKTPSRRASAEKALNEAIRLQPDLTDAQLARGYFQYWVEHNYQGALTLMQQLRSSLPNNAEILQIISFISARLGKWQDSVDSINKAVTLNPRDLFTRIQAEHIVMATRDFAGVTQMVDNALQIWPNNTDLLGYKAFALQASGRLDDAQSVLNGLAPNFDEFDSSVSALWVQARLRRSPDAAIKAFTPHIQKVEGDKIQMLLLYGDLLELAGRKAESREAFARARDKFEAQLINQPDNAEIIGPLAYAYAGLGQRDAAEKALDKFKALASNDARATGTFGDVYSRIMARFGNKDEAISSLERALSKPCDGITGMPPTPELLRLDPDYDSLRDDPRFQKLAEDKSK
jgi:TolB-like protein/class 3 adenylate cyclase/predicted Zn-dependent protease